MQRGRGGRDGFFGFGNPSSGFGGFGQPGSLISSFFGGRDPFDDPFFTQPFGGMMGPSMFGPSLFGQPRSMFGEMGNASFIEEAPQPSKSKGPVIRELSDEEEGEEEENDKKQKLNSRKHSRSGKEPYVQEPEEETEEKKSKHTQYRNDFSRAINPQPQTRSYSFQSSTVTYGGPGGAYYTSSTARKTAGDGTTVEERKEADTTTGRASHRLARGIRDKGHSVTRRLGSDGRVDTMQTLHNLNEDELGRFNEAWEGSARQHFPGFHPVFDMLANGNTVKLHQFNWSDNGIPLLEHKMVVASMGEIDKKPGVWLFQLPSSHAILHRWDRSHTLVLSGGEPDAQDFTALVALVGVLSVREPSLYEVDYFIRRTFSLLMCSRRTLLHFLMVELLMPKSSSFYIVLFFTL